MVCSKCKKDIPDNSVFCMFCGNSIKGKRAKYTNGEFIAKCSKALYDEVSEEIVGLSLDDLYGWLHSYPAMRVCYGISVHYKEMRRNAANEWYGLDVDDFIGVPEFEELVKDKRVVSISYNICEREILKNYISKLGTSLLLSYDECKRVIDEMHLDEDSKVVFDDKV